jgi:lysophospholipase L1-like esterase
MMKQVLVYGDSLSWGLVPGTSERDGVHMDADQHLILGDVLAQFISKSVWACTN